MKKSIFIALGIILGIIIVLATLYFVKRNLTYNEGLQCFDNKQWDCAVQKLKNLNYKDSNKKYIFALAEVKTSYAEESLKNKEYKHALNLYKEVSLLVSNDELKYKIENLEILVKEQDRLDKIRKKEEQEIAKIKKKQQQEENRKRAIKAKISSTAFYPIPTKFGEGYDNTIRRYGVATINRINKLAPKVAELVAQNPRCTRVMTLDVADDKSTRNSITFFVDCGDINNVANIERFYVTEKQIYASAKTREIPKSTKEQMESISEAQYLTMCQAEIKARLNYPSTFKSNILLNSVAIRPMGTVVTVKFKAKNAFNLEINHIGTCNYKEGGNLAEISIVEK